MKAVRVIIIALTTWMLTGVFGGRAGCNRLVTAVTGSPQALLAAACLIVTAAWGLLRVFRSVEG